jgi:hypothetical protein
MEIDCEQWLVDSLSLTLCPLLNLYLILVIRESVGPFTAVICFCYLLSTAVVSFLIFRALVYLLFTAVACF